MATITIALRLGDINCRQNGHHLEIVTDDGIIINLSPGAIAELYNDLSDQWRDMTYEQNRMWNEEKAELAPVTDVPFWTPEKVAAQEIRYFGTGLTKPGHYWHECYPDSILYNNEWDLARKFSGIDPEKIPDKSRGLKVGEYIVYEECGHNQHHCIVAYLGAPGDKRPGSKSIFVLPHNDIVGIITEEQALELLETYPFYREVRTKLLAQAAELK